MSGSRVWFGALSALALAVGAVATGVATAATAATVFVSPSGDDSAAGTATAPVRSLTRARDLARAQGSGTTVQLADGTYRLTSPLTPDGRDSGITWTAATGTHPVASGGVRVTGWSLADPAKGLWSAAAPARPTDTRPLYANGVPAPRPRGPAPAARRATATGDTAAPPG